MGALIVVSLTMSFLLVLPMPLPWQFKAVVFGVYVAGLAAVWVWTVVMTFKQPRHLAYGPSELLENNRIDHEFNLAMKKLELEHQVQPSLLLK